MKHYDEFIDKLKTVLRLDQIQIKSEDKGALQDVSGFEREVPAILFPENDREIKNILSLANRHKVALYPVSCGKNWGLGSKLPFKDHQCILDLSRLKKIIEVNEEFGFATVEPGVTQAALAEHLKKMDRDFFLMLQAQQLIRASLAIRSSGGLLTIRCAQMSLRSLKSC